MKYIHAHMQLKDTPFVDLMQKRICNVLLIANPYDAFMLEDDGRIDEKIFTEYAKLGLRFPPRFIQVSTEAEARKKMLYGDIDLVICMPAAENNDVFDIARSVKNHNPNTPIVVLTPFSHGVTRRMKDEDLSAFEYVFCWLGNTELLLSIIKLMEDKMNLEHDIRSAGVQMLLVVEDTIRFYSSILPNLYKYILNQSLAFASEALNSSLETLRMRGRPKIVLARTYEEAWKLYEQFADNTLGVISDCRFPIYNNSTQMDEMAGYKLLSCIRARDPYVPLIMESSEAARQELATAVMETTFYVPTCAVYQNVNAYPQSDPDMIKQNLIEQLTASVRWTQTVQNMVADGASSFRELGPGNVLQGLIKKIAPEAVIEA